MLILPPGFLEDARTQSTYFDMKKTIFVFLALASAVQADLPAGSWSDDENWGIKATGSTVASSDGAGWYCPTTVYTFDNSISLKMDEVLTFSYDIANSGENVLTAVSFLATVDGSRKGISISRSDYSSADISLGIDVAQEGYKNNFADVFAFQQTNATDRVQKLTLKPEYTLSSVGNGTVTAEIRWDNEADAFMLTVSADTVTDSISVELGQSVTIEQLGVGLDGAAHSITSVSLSVVPEPATATLSLLALAGLAARRRRR